MGSSVWGGTIRCWDSGSVYGGRGPQARCMGVEDLRLGVWG